MKIHPRRQPFRTLPSLVVLSAMMLLAGCAKNPNPGGGAPGGPSGGPSRAPVPVLAETASRKDVPVLIKVIGSVEPIHSVSVRSLVGGELLRVGFQEGREVRKGDALFVVDPKPFESVVAAAEAAVARDKARFGSADSDARRYADLAAKDYVTRQQYDQAVANAAALEATVRSSQAALERARLDLGYTTIRAHIGGITGSLLVRPGNLIKANDTQSLVVIHQIDPIYVGFTVPEDRLGEIRRRQADGPLTVEAVVPGDGSRVLRGELTFIDNAVDEATGTILLKATFPNPERGLWPGQFVNVRLRLATRSQVVVIPAQAVAASQGGDIVYVVKPDMTVETRKVVAADRMDGEVVVEQGLEAGERVVTDGQLRLTPGAKVEIRSSIEAPADRGPGGASAAPGRPAAASGGSPPAKAGASSGASGR